MPTIVFASAKGGAGKTSSALILATQLAQGAKVTVIDADPNHPIATWATGPNKPANLTVVADADENTIRDKIKAAAAQTQFVIVDLEGTASRIVVRAASRADLVIVPTQGSQLDAEQAARALRVVKDTSHEETGSPLTYSVLLTRTNSVIRTRTLTHIVKGLNDAGIPVFETELNEREAFKAMFAFRQPLEHLDPGEVANLDKAIANAKAFATEVIATLRKKKAAKSETTA